VSAVRPTVRVRLTAYYTTLFVGCTVLVMAAAYWLMYRHITATLPEGEAGRALAELAWQFALVLLGSRRSGASWPTPATSCAAR